MSNTDQKTAGHGDHRGGQTEEEEEEDQTCGWGPLKPQCCQRFRNPPCVLLWLCVAGAIQGLVVNGFVNVVISNIERRYDLSSTESGFIASIYDVAVVLCLLPLTYFGGFGCKPRYLGIGLFIIGLGSFVFTIPHFAVGKYMPVDSDDNVMCSNNSTSVTCSTNSKLSDFKYLFYLGQFLHGVGAAPLYTLGYTYLFENLPLRSSSLYFGIYTTLAIIGPAIGYVAGGAFLDIYVDINKIDSPSEITVDSSSSRYVGAWWMGFLISGVLGVLVSIPLGGFPKSLPGSAKYVKERDAEVYHRNTNDKPETKTDLEEAKISLKRIYKTAKVLFTNPTYIFITLFEATEALLVGGFSTFSPKFIESQFSVQSSTAALYVGFVTIPAGGGGALFGGYIIKRLNLRVRGIIKLCIISAFVCIVFFLTFAIVHCENVPFAGVNIRYGQSPKNSTKDFLGQFETGTCSSGCNCQLETYSPICGIDGVTYYSPCYAGCQSTATGGYHNCSCLNYYNSNTSYMDYTAEPNKCKSSCWYLPLFLPLFAVIVFATFIPEVPAVAATLRCLPQEERSIGMGVQSVIGRCLGSIPGPVLFGKMIDLTCTLWQTKCDDQGSCYFYNNTNMSYNILAVAMVAKVLSIVFLFLSLYFYKVKKETEEETTISAAYTVSNDSLHKDKDFPEIEFKDSDRRGIYTVTAL